MITMVLQQNSFLSFEWNDIQLIDDFGQEHPEEKQKDYLNFYATRNLLHFSGIPEIYEKVGFSYPNVEWKADVASGLTSVYKLKEPLPQQKLDSIGFKECNLKCRR